MTLKEADEVATKRLPVTHQGVIYKRITQVGYKYSEDGKKIPFVRLEDTRVHSYTDANPQQCDPISENKEKNDETADNC